MSFAGLLGAGLLGGVANAAKGVGDKLREEAKQKRAMALVDQAQENALDLQEAVAEDNINQAKAEGKITIEVGDAGSTNNIDEIEASGGVQSDLLAQKGDIATAQLLLQSSLSINETLYSQNNLADIEKKRDEFKRLADLGLQANAAELQQAQTELEAAIATTTASVQATTDATTAETLAGYATATQAAAAAFDAKTAEVKHGYDMATLSKTGKQQLLLLNREYELKVQAAIDTQIGDIETFYDETTGMDQKWEKTASGWEKRGGEKAPDASTSKGLTLQVAYNDKGEEVKGYMNGTEFVQVGAAKAAKAGTKKEALTYFTGQAKYILSGSPNVFVKPKLTDDDAALMSEWIAEAEASFAANPKTSLSQIVKNIMFKPWVLDDNDITGDDIDQAETQKKNAGSGALSVREYSRQIAQKRQPEFVNAQTAYNNIKAKNGNTDALFKRMRKMGYDPDLLIK